MFIRLLYVFYYVTLSNTQRVNSIQKRTVSDCKSNEYFDIAHLMCKPCPTEQIGDGYKCRCAPNAKLVKNLGGPVECQPCADQSQVATKDGWDCVQCEQSSPTTASQCASCNENSINYARTLFGVLDPTQRCSECRGNTMPSPEGDHCVACNPGIAGAGQGCHCLAPNLLVGGICFTPADLMPDQASLYTMKYSGNLQVDSAYLRINFRAAEALCKTNNWTACQLLGNICAMQMYNRDSGSCAAYLRLSSASGIQIEWPQYMPWLYYNTEAPTILQSFDLLSAYTFDSSSFYSRLNLRAATYTLNGTYVGLQNITGGFLQLCKNAPRVMDAAYLFGRVYKQKCTVTAKDLWDYPLEFYDLYLEYETGEGNAKESQLYAVPILNLNIEEGGRLVNTLSGAETKLWRLTRRMFLVDAVSGKDVTDKPAKVVRYLSYIGIFVELQTSKNGRIFPPYVKIEYSDVRLESADSADRRVTIEFETHYTMSTARHEKDIEITMGVLCTLGALWAALKTWSWTKRSGRVAVDFVTLLKFLIFLGATIADIFFIVMLAMSLWLLVFYKRQRTVVLVLPASEQEYSFLIYTGLAAALKFVEVINLIIEQVTARIFFVDWERPRGYVIPTTVDAGDVTQKPAPVTIWRTYLVANEWNELQTYRKTSYALQLFAMVFFLKVLNLEALALVEPDATLYDVPTEYQDTKLSRFAVAATLYLAIGFVQWFINVLIIEQCILDNFHNFADLCSISNISVFILRFNQFGYYIHGRSVHGHADTNMREMNEMLQRERENLCSQRGLEPNTEQQSFISCLPSRFRVQYERILSPLTNPNLPQNRMTSAGDAVTVKVENIIQVYEEMNQYLTTFIDHCVPDVDYFIRDRQVLECVCDMEFQNTLDKGVFYRDRSDQAFTGVLFYGHEWTLLTFDLLLFCMIDFIAHNFLIAAVVAFLIITAVRNFRATGGKKNLARTSLVDERFLI